MFNTKLPLNQTNILSYVDEYSLIKYYFSQFKGIGIYKSNLRENDIKHSLSFIYKYNRFIISDFGVNEFIGLTTFKYLQILLKYPLTKDGYMNLLDRIVKDFNLPIESYNPNYVNKNSKPKIYHVKMTNKRSIKIEYKTRNWFSWNIDYKIWGIIGDPKKLKIIFKDLRIYPLKTYWINGVKYNVSQNNPTYLFLNHTKRKQKLYTPFDKKFKWISTISNNDIIGIDSLVYNTNFLLIEKSVKDTVIARYLGYNTLPMNSESMFIPKKVILKLQTQYSNIIAHFDNDPAGIKASQKFEKMYNIKTFTFDRNMPKDNYDVLKTFNVKKLKNELIKKLEHGTEDFI